MSETDTNTATEKQTTTPKFKGRAIFVQFMGKDGKPIRREDYNNEVLGYTAKLVKEDEYDEACEFVKTDEFKKQLQEQLNILAEEQGGDYIRENVDDIEVWFSGAGEQHGQIDKQIDFTALLLLKSFLEK